MKKAIKLVLKILASLIALVVLVAGIYVAYVFASYSRIENNVTLEIENAKDNSAQIDTQYSIMTYNIGFGAYSDDYSFFMDGGEYSRAFSENAVKENTRGSINELLNKNPDFVMMQEVDRDSTRSYHVNQYEIIKEAFPEFTSIYAINYDSAYLFYPILEPHGKSVSSIVTLSDYKITDSVRRSLPIDEGVGKLVDLDRCYTVTRVAVENGKDLCLFNVHLTAYAKDASIVDGQIDMLFSQLSEEYAKGNYVICAGDFNRDLWGNSPEVFKALSETPSWAQAFPTDEIPEHLSLCRPTNQEIAIPTCRDAKTTYVKGETFVTVLDGFIISDNIECVSLENVDAGFRYSDHNPVLLDFKLK